MPNGIVQPIMFTQYRLSRVWSGGQEYQTYNRIIVFNERFRTSGAYFIEGFKAFEFIVESWRSTWEFRKQTATPQMLFEFDRFKVIGDEDNDPEVRSRLSITPAPMGLKVNNEQDVFSVTLRDVDASHGEEIDAYNSKEYGTNTDINLYGRDVRSVNKQRNILGSRSMLTPTPPPEPISEMVIEEWQV